MPLWVVLSAHTAIALGTLTGGWRIVKTMGTKFTQLQPVGGVCAESAAAGMLFFTSASGHPGLDDPHDHRRRSSASARADASSAVRWGVAGRVVWAWVLTIPGAALIAAASYAILKMF